MFNPFKLFAKKEISRENYLLDRENYVNDDNWILALSALFIEAADLDAETQKAKHDSMMIYPSIDKLSRAERSIVEYDLILDTPKDVKSYMDNVKTTWTSTYELDVYFCINADTREQVAERAQKKHEDDEDQQELCEFIWVNRDRYKNMLYRVGYLAFVISQIRLAHYFGVIDEKTSWKHLHTIADLIRPLMTLFASWEEYNHNLRLFYEVYYYEKPEHRKFIEQALTVLENEPASPLKLIPIHFGVDQNYAYNLKSHSNIFAKRTDLYDSEILVQLKKLLKNEDKKPLWQALDSLSDIEREYYYPMFLNFCDRHNCEEVDLIDLPEAYPDNSYAYQIRAQYFESFAWEARGHGTSSTVGEENYQRFFERLRLSIVDLIKAHELDPENVIIWGSLYNVISVYNTDEFIDVYKKIFQLIESKALRNPYCTRLVSSSKQKRWGGSHEENLDWARQVIAGSQRGDVCRLIIFEVILERYNYIYSFDDDEEKADKIFKDKKNIDEVNQYFDELVENMHKAPYRIAQILSYWYSMVNDCERLRRVGQTMQAGAFDLDALEDYYNEDTTEAMMNWIRSV